MYYLNYPVKVSIASLKPIGYLTVNPCQGHAVGNALPDLLFVHYNNEI